MAESAPPSGELPEVKSVAQQAPTAVAGMFAKRSRRRDVAESVAPAATPARAPAPARPRPMDDDDNDAGVDLAAVARAQPAPVKPKVVETTFGALLKSVQAAAVNEGDDDDDDAPIFESVGPSAPPMKSTKLAALALGRMTIRR
jgi:hypothetical protein